jgi:hypothetical protein
MCLFWENRQIRIQWHATVVVYWIYANRYDIYLVYYHYTSHQKLRLKINKQQIVVFIHYALLRTFCVEVIYLFPTYVNFLHKIICLPGIRVIVNRKIIPFIEVNFVLMWIFLLCARENCEVRGKAAMKSWYVTNLSLMGGQVTELYWPPAGRDNFNPCTFIYSFSNNSASDAFV